MKRKASVPRKNSNCSDWKMNDYISGSSDDTFCQWKDSAALNDVVPQEVFCLGQSNYNG